MVLSLSNVYIFLLGLYIASMKTKFINEGEDQYFIEGEGLGNFAKKNHEKQNRARGAMGKNRASALCYPGSVF